MHEYSLVQSLLEEVLHQARENGARRVLSITLQKGSLSDESEEALRFYWEELSHQTLAEGATLQIETVSEEMQCLECGMSFPVEGEIEVCPNCAGRYLRSKFGDALILKSLQLET